MEKILIGFLVALLFVCIDPVKATCVLESDFGFTLNCAFKKSGLFRVRNLGGFKAHVGLGFSVGDELGFGQSLTNLDTSRRRSVNVKNGAPPNTIGVLNEQPQRQEKRGKQNRLTVRMPSPSPPAVMQPAPNPANMAAMQAILANTVKRRGTPAAPHMQPIIVQGESPEYQQTSRARQSQITLAKPFPLGVPPFKPLPPKDQSDVRVLPISNPTKQMYIAYPVADSKGPALPYTKPNSQATHDHVSKLLAQMTSLQNRQQQLTQRQDHLVKITPAPVRTDNIGQNLMTSHNNHVNLPAFQELPSSVSKITESPISYGLSVVPGPVFKNTVQIPTAPSMMSKGPTIASLTGNTVSLRKSQPAAPSAYPTAPSYSGQKYSQDAEMATNVYPIYAQSPVQKIDDVNSITGYGDEDEFKYSHEDEVAQKITAISKATNISVEAVEAAILLRQQQLLNRYAAISPSAASTTTSTTTSTTPRPTLAPEIIIEPVTPKRYVVANTAKVMNAPREYYPIGYEKNFDDQFTSRVELPETSFYCGDQKFFPGLYADENLGCMVFHVCALTDDGLVMKSFLCPESTLFDQTILKCNWWFYVDCKNSKSLYDTNIPISKSYQLMKALTFFSNYKKETQQAEQAPAPANMDGIKEAIAILENHKSETQTAETAINETKPSGISVATPPRNGSIQNHRLNREFKERPLRNNSGEESAVHSAINQAAIDTLKVTPKPAEDTVDTNKVDRRRRLGQFSRRNKNNTINKYSTLDSTTSVLAESVSTTSAPEIQPITSAEEVKESSTHHRIARASEEDIPDLVAAESHTDSLYVASPDKSILGEKPRIGKEATIAKLDEAIIGKPESQNRKKVNVIEIITPQSASS